MTDVFEQMSADCVYKIVPTSDWERACAKKLFHRSADDERDGFIHLSAAAQIGETLQRHFAGRDDLVIVAFAADSLIPHLKWEPSRGGELFPHYYGDLSTRLALWCKRLERSINGTYLMTGDHA